MLHTSGIASAILRPTQKGLAATLGKMKIKKMKLGINLVVISIIGVVLLCGCERCVMKELPSQNFTDEELHMVPYLKGDTLIFRCEETNETSKYRVIDKISAYEKFSRGNPHDKYSLYCTGDWYYSQHLITSFDIKNCGIELNISNSFEVGNISRILSIYFSIPNDIVILQFYGRYKIGPDTIMTGTNQVYAYHDSLTLNGTRSINVYELTRVSDTARPDYLKTAFYSLNQGLVGFLTNNGNMWSLKK